jgi:hypothetical protein
MCIKCEKLEQYKDSLDKCKMMLLAVVDVIDEVMDRVVCDNILIEDQDAVYIFNLEEGYNADYDTSDCPSLEDVSDEELQTPR